MNASFVDTTRFSNQNCLTKMKKDAGSFKKNNPERCVKTKSKEAARLRRNKENDEFRHLSLLLPLQNEISKQLDKASIIRLVINYLKLRHLFNSCDIFKETSYFHIHRIDVASFIPSCLDGFLFILSNDGKFLYVSESVSAILGLSQVVLIGTSIFEYIHPEDQTEMWRYLQSQSQNKNVNNVYELDQSKIKFSFTIRFKSSLLKKISNGRSNGWRLLQIMGKSNSGNKNFKSFDALFCMASSIDCQIFNDLPLETNSFVVKLNFDFFIEAIENLPKELDDVETITQYVGKSIFHLVHPSDLNELILKLNELKKKEYVSFLFRLGLNVPNERSFVKCLAILIQKNSPTYSTDLSTVEQIPAQKEQYQIILVCDLICSSDLNNYCLDLDKNEHLCEHEYLKHKLDRFTICKTNAGKYDPKKDTINFEKNRHEIKSESKQSKRKYSKKAKNNTNPIIKINNPRNVTQYMNCNFNYQPNVSSRIDIFEQHNNNFDKY